MAYGDMKSLTYKKLSDGKKTDLLGRSLAGKAARKEAIKAGRKKRQKFK